MPDSFNYETGTIDTTTSEGGVQWAIINKLITFINGLGGGWSTLDYSGFNRNFTAHNEYLTTQTVNWNPRQIQLDHLNNLHNHGDTGLCPYVATNDPTYNLASSEKDKGRTAYFRWTDGSSDSDFFIATVDDFDGETYGDLRLGTLFAPFETPMYFGEFGTAAVAHDDGFGGCTPTSEPPDPDYTENFCNLGVPTVSDENPYTSRPWGFRGQPGYFGEAVANFLLPDGTDPAYNYHFFGGEEGGSPFLYAVIEGLMNYDPIFPLQRNFTHFSFGKLKPQFDYLGGEFVNGMNTSIFSTYDFFSNQHARPFDGNTSANPGILRSYLKLRTDGEIFDPDNVSTWHHKYEFGWPSSKDNRRCWGQTFGGINTNLISRSLVNPAFGRAPLLRPLILLEDEGLNGEYTIAGLPPAFKVVMMKNTQPDRLYTDTEGQVWRIFPGRNKKYTDNATPYSSEYGYAYRVG